MALTSGSLRIENPTPYVHFLEETVSGSSTMYAGAIALYDRDNGNVVSGTNGAGYAFAGIAQETATGDGSKTVKLHRGMGAKFTSIGTELATSGSATVGMDALCVDDETVGAEDDAPNGASVGEIISNDGSTVWVLTGHYTGTKAGS